MRCILVEFDYQREIDGDVSTGTLYFSDQVFFDDVTNKPFVCCIRSAPQFSRSLSGDNFESYVSSIGSLELDNADGQLDFMLNLACDGSQIRFYYGDPTWPRADFRLIFNALTVRISAPTYDRLSITLKDTGLLLNQSIGGTSVVGGTGPNAERQRPVNFGYIHNLEAIVLDAALLVYVHSDTGSGTAVVEVRDKGVSVPFTDNGDGTFTLLASPDGTVTCDILAQPDGVDNRTVSDAMQHLVGERAGLIAAGLYFGAAETFTIHDDDDYLIGISLPESRNIIDALNEIADSGNCFWAITRTGEFAFGRLRLNDIEGLAVDATDIFEDDLDNGSFKLDHASTLYYRYQGYMSRNWNQQTDFASSLAPDEQAVYSRKGLYLLQDESLGTTYELAPELYNKTLAVSPVIDTLLSTEFAVNDTDLLARWMSTRRTMTLPWVETLTMAVGIDFYELELGKVVRLTHPRFGQDEGVLFQVVGIDIRLSPAKIELRIARRTIIQDVPDTWTRVESAVDESQQKYEADRPIFIPIDINPGNGVVPISPTLTSFGYGGIGVGIATAIVRPRSASGYVFMRARASGNTKMVNTAHDVALVDYFWDATRTTSASTPSQGDPVFISSPRSDVLDLHAKAYGGRGHTANSGVVTITYQLLSQLPTGHVQLQISGFSSSGDDLHGGAPVSHILEIGDTATVPVYLHSPGGDSSEVFTVTFNGNTITASVLAGSSDYAYDFAHSYAGVQMTFLMPDSPGLIIYLDLALILTLDSLLD